MTSSSTPQTNPPTAQQQTIILNIDRFLTEGMPVFDLNRERVGDVQMYSTAAGYLMVGTGALEEQALYIPFRLIQNIDPNEIYLSAPKDVLRAEYRQPPAITTVVESRLVPGPHGAMTQQSQEIQRVASGYDGMPVALNRVDVGSVANDLSVGMAVYDSDNERLGDITQYDTTRSLLVVEKGIFKPRVMFVPFSAIQRIDRDALSVYLSLPKDVLVKEHTLLSGDTSAT